MPMYSISRNVRVGSACTIRSNKIMLTSKIGKVMGIWTDGQVATILDPGTGVITTYTMPAGLCIRGVTQVRVER